MAALLLILSVCLLPTSLITAELLPFDSRFVVFGIGWGLAVLYALRGRIPAGALGFRLDNLGPSVAANLGFVLLSLPVLWFLSHHFRPDVSYHPFGNGWALFAIYCLFLVPLQQLVYRSLLMHELRGLTLGPIAVILVSTLVFWGAHFIYDNPVMIGLTLVSGLAWSAIYYFVPNFWGSALGHAMAGGAAILFQLI